MNIYYKQNKDIIMIEKIVRAYKELCSSKLLMSSWRKSPCFFVKSFHRCHINISLSLFRLGDLRAHWLSGEEREHKDS